ncbi:hypothetical protein E2C01_066917 [Portunus trituberculatus]|uniref:Uncharacterized protein n=1 Tax=Portunus trituberculatus TaxID=210409 RepID=A0A5B7HS96_PORTR|nr:hypothetical protein [Portunus trituberculatus]
MAGNSCRTRGRSCRLVKGITPSCATRASSSTHCSVGSSADGRRHPNARDARATARASCKDSLLLAEVPAEISLTEVWGGAASWAIEDKRQEPGGGIHILLPQPAVRAQQLHVVLVLVLALCFFHAPPFVRHGVAAARQQARLPQTHVHPDGTGVAHRSVRRQQQAVTLAARQGSVAGRAAGGGGRRSIPGQETHRVGLQREVVLPERL